MLSIYHLLTGVCWDKFQQDMSRYRKLDPVLKIGSVAVAAGLITAAITGSLITPFAVTATVGLAAFAKITSDYEWLADETIGLITDY